MNDTQSNSALQSVCVYCGSGRGKNPAYVDAARALGGILAKSRIALVYGGGSLGLMGETARAVLWRHTDEVISTLQSVAEGQLAIDPQLLREALTTREEPIDAGTPRQRAEAYSVTPREHDVLTLVAEGLTNKEIGARLSITEDTVKKHVQNIIWKMRAADRTQAAILAYRMGLLDADD